MSSGITWLLELGSRVWPTCEDLASVGVGGCQDCVLPVELYMSVEIGALEDARVVVVTYDLVAHGIGRLVVNRVTHIPPPDLGPRGFP